MTDPVAILTSAMNHDLSRLEVASRNLSNIETGAYKRQVSIDRHLFEGMLADGAVSNVSADEMSMMRDFSQGTLKVTNRQHDLAIEGDGFFTVLKEGILRFTRSGDFKVSAEGYLSTNDGGQVYGENGAIYVGAMPFSIDHLGVVLQEGVEVDQLNLALFEDNDPGEYLGSGLFAGGGQIEGEAGRVRQGYLEASNVNVMEEVVTMLELTRHFETSQAALKGYDDMLDIAINQIGSVGG